MCIRDRTRCLARVGPPRACVNHNEINIPLPLFQDGKLTVDEFLKIADVQPLILECITLHIPQLAIAEEPDGIGI